jgi:BirA family biotin operon repressor/biotin-[acetyl-CoA-carboxylase] ligase
MPLDLGGIQAAFPGRQIVWFETISSTMTEATRLAMANCPSGTVVGAEEQTQGQGRYNRTWHSEKEAGLYISIVLRLPLPSASLPILTLALGVAVQDAIARGAGVACDLRWPNDVMAGDKKCAGILVQLVDKAMVAGIGINVNQLKFPIELMQSATSLRLVSGREHSREKILVCVLESVDDCCGILVASGPDSILRLYSEGSSFVFGRRVVVTQENAVIEGTTEGLDSSGFLIIRKDDGSCSLITTGGVRPV